MYGSILRLLLLLCSLVQPNRPVGCTPLFSDWTFDLTTEPLFHRHLAPNFALGKLYTSTLMSSLNARSVWSYDDANNAPSSGRVTPGIISTSEVRLSSRSTSGPPPVLPEVKSFHGTRDQEKLARTASRSDVYEASTCDLPSSSLPPKEFVSVQV